MSSVVVVGAQWGDEGKGKVVDICTEAADMVVRYAGGPNAGHTLVVNGAKLIVRLIPSGILHEKTACILGQGMAIDPATLVGELDELDRRNVRYAGRLFASDKAHVITPYHVLIDTLREAGPDAIGTTKRGVGPCYEDKAARRGVRLGDLRDATKLRHLIGAAVAAWSPVIRALGDEPPEVEAVVTSLLSLVPRLTPLIADTAPMVQGAVRAEKNVLFEGAQGALLDIDFGTYPFVTSSHSVAGGACVGSGVGPSQIDFCLGLVKAYCTRVGGGPFPTELVDDAGDHLRNVGQEYGSVTGRPRRTGWLDLPALRYAVRVNGIDAIALTKIDVLSGMKELKVCVRYRVNGTETDEFPIDDLATAIPVYENLATWTDDISAIRDRSRLPAAVQKYIEFIEKNVECAVTLISVGPSRDETIGTSGIFDSIDV